MPLMKSNLRIDPVLFKDPVAITRKKYRQIEVVIWPAANIILFLGYLNHAFTQFSKHDVGLGFLKLCSVKMLRKLGNLSNQMQNPWERFT